MSPGYDLGLPLTVDELKLPQGTRPESVLVSRSVSASAILFYRWNCLPAGTDSRHDPNCHFHHSSQAFPARFLRESECDRDHQSQGTLRTLRQITRILAGEGRAQERIKPQHL